MTQGRGNQQRRQRPARFVPLLALLMPIAVWSAPAPVAPGRIFRSTVLDIRAPDSDGWLLMQSSPGSWIFGRPGKSSTASDIASVTGFALAETTTSEELVALIRHGVENDTSSDRFKTTGGTLEYTDARGYPCVRYQVTTLDTNARVSYFRHASLTLQADSLYCRHPTQPTLGFAISYSHRGPEPDPDFAQRAQAFIDGVTVPTVDAAPAEASEDRP